jgi:hypothetical protein
MITPEPPGREAVLSQLAQRHSTRQLWGYQWQGYRQEYAAVRAVAPRLLATLQAIHPNTPLHIGYAGGSPSLGGGLLALATACRKPQHPALVPTPHFTLADTHPVWLTHTQQWAQWFNNVDAIEAHSLNTPIPGVHALMLNPGSLFAQHAYPPQLPLICCTWGEPWWRAWWPLKRLPPLLQALAKAPRPLSLQQQGWQRLSAHVWLKL